MKLISPNYMLKSKFHSFYTDFKQKDAENAGCYKGAVENYETYVTMLLDEEKGVNLRSGYVQCTNRWLLDDENQIVGVIRIRHHINNPFLREEAGHIGYDIAPSQRGKGYGTMILKLGLEEARSIGLDKVLLVADEANVPSWKVIEKNGGIKECSKISEHFGTPIVRYWIYLENF